VPENALVWSYDNLNKQWKVFSNDDDIISKIQESNYGLMDILGAHDGFWINVSSDTSISLSVADNVNDQTNDVKVDYFSTGDAIDSASLIEENVQYLNQFLNQHVHFYKVLIDSTGEYAFSTENNNDAYGALYDESGVLIAFDDESGIDSNFKIVSTLDAGTYYLKVMGFKVSEDYKVQYYEDAKYFSGQAIGENGLALENITVSLTLPTGNIEATTDSDGYYSFKTTESVPSTVALIASADDYLTESVSLLVDDEHNYKNNFILNKGNSSIFQVEILLHHLGDDKFGGTTNSQFQLEAEGTEFTKYFDLPNEYLSQEQTNLELFIKGSQDSILASENRIYINTIFVGSLGDSPEDGSFEKISINFPTSYLKEIDNNITIFSGYTNDYDDIEFTNIKLIGSSTDIESNLLAYYSLDNDTNDYSGNNFHAADESSEIVENNTSYTFSASSDVAIQNSYHFNFNNYFTVFAKVKQNINSEGYLFSKYSDDGNIRYSGLFMGDTSDNYIKFFYTSDGTNTEALEWSTNISDDIERAIAIVIDYPTATLYIDGVSQGSKKMSSKMIAGESDIVLGKRYPNDFHFNGTIDDVRFYNRALTNTEILKLSK